MKKFFVQLENESLVEALHFHETGYKTLEAACDSATVEASEGTMFWIWDTDCNLVLRGVVSKNETFKEIQ